MIFFTVAKETLPEHKYAYKFGNTDRGILLAVLMAGLFLTALVGTTAIGAALSPAEKVEDGSSGSLGGFQAIAPAIGVVLVSDCFTITLILIVLTVVTYIIYRLLSWVEQKCRNLCKCKWYKPWCCVGRLFCWLVTITKWVALVVTALLAVATVVSFLYCIWHVVSGY